MVGGSKKPRMVSTLLVVIAAVTLMLIAARPAPAPAAPNSAVVTADAAIATTCGAAPVRIPARWYLPTGPAKALVWLQHGFARTPANLDTLAHTYADNGFLVVSPTLDSVSLGGCAVAFNLTDNASFARTLAGVFGGSANSDDALSASLDTAAVRAHRQDITMPEKLVFSGHSAGGEFVLVAANALRTADPAAFRRLSGLMLFDPVNSFFGGHFFTAARELGDAGLPIRVIASQPSMSNTAGFGVAELQRTTRQPFLGVRLVTGIHVDVESDDTDLLGIASELALPRPRNGRVLRTLATRWSSDMVTGTTTPAYYPGGDYYRLLLRTNTITTLPVG